MSYRYIWVQNVITASWRQLRLPKMPVKKISPWDSLPQKGKVVFLVLRFITAKLFAFKGFCGILSLDGGDRLGLQTYVCR